MLPTYNGSQCTGACDEGCSHAERFDEGRGIRRLEVKHERGGRVYIVDSIESTWPGQYERIMEQEARWGDVRVSANDL